MLKTMLNLLQILLLQMINRYASKQNTRYRFHSDMLKSPYYPGHENTQNLCLEVLTPLEYYYLLYYQPLE